MNVSLNQSLQWIGASRRPLRFIVGPSLQCPLLAVSGPSFSWFSSHLNDRSWEKRTFSYRLLRIAG